MPQCMHQGHKAETCPLKLSSGKVVQVNMVLGWNPIHRRFESCDEGLIPRRKAGMKKRMRRAEED